MVAIRFPFLGLRMPVETWPILAVMGALPPLIGFFSARSWQTPRASLLSDGSYRMSNAQYINNVIGDREEYHRLRE